MLRLLRNLIQLARAWWQVDRPRISPSVGRLLRIEPPAILRIGPQVAGVVGRSVGEDGSGPYVVYHCQVGSEACQLRVPFPLSPLATLHWSRGEARWDLMEEDIEVFDLTNFQARDFGVSDFS